MERKHWILAGSLVICAVIWMVTMSPVDIAAQYEWMRVNVLSDAPQGFTKYKEVGLQADGNATSTTASRTSGYWIHRFGIKQIATHTHATTPVVFYIRPYASDTDSTSLVAT